MKPRRDPQRRERDRRARQATALVVRDDPTALFTRASTFAPSSHDEATRSFEAVLVTDAPTFSWDMFRHEVVLDAYPMEGFRPPAGDQVPLLDSHNRGSIGDQLGSIRQHRVDGARLVVRVFFGSTAAANDAYTLVRDGHARDVSAGFAPLKTVRVVAGTSQRILGREWTAPADRDLLVRTEWSVKEGSITPIGADGNAKFRSETPPGAHEMNKFLECLYGFGLSRSATEDQAWTYYHDRLTDAQRSEAQRLLPEGTSIPQRHAPPTQPPAPVLTPEPARAPQPTAPPAPPADEATIRAAAATAERQRIARINELAGTQVSRALVQQAIDEGWSPERFAEPALQQLRDQRAGNGTQDLFQGGIHSRGENDITVEVLQAGLIQRRAANLVDRRVNRSAGRCAQLPGWLLENVDSPQRAQVMDRSHEFRAISLVDLCRHSLRLHLATRGEPIYVRGQRIDHVPHDYETIVRAGVSTGVFGSVFSTSMNLEILAGYEDAPDTTDGWCSRHDDPNFKPQEAATMTSFGGGLKPHRRGGTAEHTAYSDEKETYRIGRYSQQFAIDDMDLIDDSFGILEDFGPSEMGAEARRLAPDLAYAILLSNPNMRDGVALFHANHGNNNTLAFSAANLETALARQSEQRVDGRSKNLRARYILVPPRLWFAAEREVTSALRNSGDGDQNVLQRQGLTVVMDDRLSVAGVTDPATGTAYAGSATTWFTACRPGEGGARTIRIAYRAGTNRQPQTSSGNLTQGSWGVWFAVNLDIGAKALDWACLQRGNT